MGTEVLRPQDCLAERLRVSSSAFHHRRKYYPATGNGFGYTKNNHVNHNIINNYGYRKPSPVRTYPQKKFHQQEITNPTRLPSPDNFKVISIGKVSILRRGASLDSLNQKIKKDHSNNKAKTSTNNDLVFFQMQRLGPDVPEIFPTQIRLALPDTMYAGSAFSVSPPPSDLPLPTFFRKQSFDDSATRDLRRLLRIE